jgi:hypothetical protein
MKNRNAVVRQISDGVTNEEVLWDFNNSDSIEHKSFLIYLGKYLCI